MKNLYREMLHPLAFLLAVLCIVENMAVDIRVPGQIIADGRTRNRLVSPANAYPRTWVEMMRSSWYKMGTSWL